MHFIFNFTSLWSDTPPTTTTAAMTYKAKKIVSELFDLFVSEPQLLPEEWRVYKSKNELYTCVGDYIASMTDKNAMNIHQKYFNLYNF